MDITVSDALEIVVSAVGGGLAVLGLASSLGRVWANRLMQKDIAGHAQALEKLKTEQAQELEKLKSSFEAANRKIQAELDKTVHVHSIQFATEFKALSEIWEKLSAVRSSMAAPSPPPFADAQHSSERLRQMNALSQRFTEAVDVLKTAVYNQAPFYPKPIYEKLEEIIVILGQAQNDLKSSADNETALSLSLEVNAEHTFLKIATLAAQISELIRERIKNLSLYRE